MVVGGGPAGMQVATIAALKGHEITLHAREHTLGGLLPIAALVKELESEDLSALIAYFKSELARLGIRIRLGKEVSVSEVETMRPDVIIVAVGGLPTLPEIPGINGFKVVSNAELHKKLRAYLRLFGPRMLRWLTKLWMPLGKKVVIIGGGMQGCQLAEFLIKRGREVSIVEMSETLGAGINIYQRVFLLKRLADEGVTVWAGVTYEEITDKGLSIITKEGNKCTIAADTIVPALPATCNTELVKMLEDKFPEIYAVGDCRKPGLIADAITDGARVGMHL